MQIIYSRVPVFNDTGLDLVSILSNYYSVHIISYTIQYTIDIMHL